MVLPVVSMEDDELFPKQPHALYEPAQRFVAEEGLEKFLSEGDSLYWSRLVIAARGYVLNLDRHSEEQIFSLDDAFILMHKVLAERKVRLTPVEYVRHLNTFFSVPNVLELLDRIDPANSGYLEPHPFGEAPFRAAFEALFGSAESPQNLHTANLQKLAYDVFARLLGILLARFNAAAGAESRRGIRFEKDAEWQPDDRVVLFQQFFEGNRTWLLHDFDRYVLEFWRPNGVQVIFGDAHVEKKQRAGFHLCDYCGMIEQQRDQFPVYQGQRFCSENCFGALLDRRR
ncbi:hypothetical protein M3Y99_01462300 [Aphelenchoides fujianensis]|nr:hypothetical protein M3Y99_01462300 [Aphelenchoides fujianensis]